MANPHIGKFYRPALKPLTPAVSRRLKIADPTIIELIKWFKENRSRMPQAGFNLTPWQKVLDAEEFYQSLEQDIALYPRGPRSLGMSMDLRRLNELVEKGG